MIGVERGMSVVSADGASLGRVGRVEEDYLEVEPEDGLAYWLNAQVLDDVGESAGMRATDGSTSLRLRVAATEVQRHKVRPPSEQSALAEERDTLTSGALPLTEAEAGEAAEFGGRTAADASGAWPRIEGESHGDGAAGGG